MSEKPDGSTNPDQVDEKLTEEAAVPPPDTTSGGPADPPEDSADKQNG